MAEDQIRYDLMTQDALRGVVRTVLEKISETGLPGDHHLYIAFDTHAPGVSVSDRLRDQYPEEMTIVLQHQFWDLEVRQDRFEVKLSFNNIPERLVVPYPAVKAFYDPSVQFGLQFGNQEIANDPESADAGLPTVLEDEKAAAGLPAVADGTGGQSSDQGSPSQSSAKDSETSERRVAEVVELDAFRKK